MFLAVDAVKMLGRKRRNASGFGKCIDDSQWTQKKTTPSRDFTTIERPARNRLNLLLKTPTQK